MRVGNAIIYRHEVATMDNNEAVFEADIRDSAVTKLPQKIRELSEQIDAVEQKVLRTEESIKSLQASDTPLRKIGRIALTAGAWAAIPVVAVASLVNLLLLYVPCAIALGISFIPFYIHEAISSKKPGEALHKTIPKMMTTFEACADTFFHYLHSLRPLAEQQAKDKLRSFDIIENPYDIPVHIYILSDNAKPDLVKRFSLEKVKSIYDAMLHEPAAALPNKAELKQRIEQLNQNIARVQGM